MYTQNEVLQSFLSDVPTNLFFSLCYSEPTFRISKFMSHLNQNLSNDIKIKPFAILMKSKLLLGTDGLFSQESVLCYVSL